MAELREGFRFSQRSLQDYLDCKRRFQLRYIMAQPWPAHVAEPVDVFEQQVELGQRFHKLAQQFFLNLSVDLLNTQASAMPLSVWWQAFLSDGIRDLPEVRLPELTRATLVEGFVLVGTFDLVALDRSGEVLVVDWKTGKFIPPMSEVRRRMQSRLYPYILAREGLPRSGYEQLAPDQIRMRYWYAEAARLEQEFAYSHAQFEEDDAFLKDLISEIAGMQAEDAPLTDDLSTCRYCPYRSLCDRGISGGSIIDLEADMDDLAEEQVVGDEDHGLTYLL